MARVQQLFEDKTHVNLDYILWMILEFLGQVKDQNNLSSIKDSTIYLTDEKASCIGILKQTKDLITIERRTSDANSKI